MSVNVSAIRLAAMLVLLMAANSPGLAHDINPLQHKGTVRSALFGSTYLLEKISKPVHETFTIIAYKCHTKFDECKGSDFEYDLTDKEEGISELIEGVIWNDDPSMKLTGGLVSKKQWGVFMYDADKIAACQRGKKGNCKEIDESFDLLYRSHYGDMQFLHSMESDDQVDAAETRRKIMEWAKFAYKVSIGEIRKEQTLAELASSGASDVNAIIKRGSWKVGFLFTRLDKPSKQSVKMAALGSLLHMVQDSYSDAHANRVQACNFLNPARKDIVEFHNYAMQDGKQHKLADRRPSWLKTGTLLNSSNPVWQSARLIQFSFNESPWADVEKVLQDEVFKLAKPTNKATSGDPTCWGAAET